MHLGSVRPCDDSDCHCCARSDNHKGFAVGKVGADGAGADADAEVDAGADAVTWAVETMAAVVDIVEAWRTEAVDAGADTCVDQGSDSDDENFVDGE